MRNPPFQGDDLLTKIQDAFPAYRERRPYALDNTIIYCPAFLSDEWVVICFVLKKNKPCQMHILCHNLSFNKVTPFCCSLSGKLNEAFCKNNYKEVKFYEKPAYTPSTIKPDDSAFACMFFLELFKASNGSCFEKFTWKSKEHRDEFSKGYRLSLLPYLMGHKNNNALVPAAIAGLITQKKPNQRNKETLERAEIAGSSTN